MDDPGVIPATASMSEEDAREPRWSGVIAFVTAWALPATTARGTRHLPLAYAWLVHVIAAVVTVLLILFAVAYVEAVRGERSVGAQVQFGLLLNDIANEVQAQPRAAILTFAAVVLAIEADFLLFALAVMPWGARDEPIRSSYRHALRQTWLRTVHFIACVILIGGLAAWLFRIEFEWNRDHYDFSGWTAPRPWYVERNAPLIVCAAFAIGLWVLWAWLRAVGVNRMVPPIERPPTCEECGYNLTTIPLESRCPECGTAVAASLGPAARPGTAWQRRRELGRWLAWWQCTVTAIGRPRDLGRQLRAILPATDHRAFLAMHLPLIFVIGFIGTVEFAVTEASVTRRMPEPPMMLLGPAFFGFACVVGTVGAAHAAACFVGLVESIRSRRNLLPAAMQAACYQVGYLVVWAVFGALTGLCLEVIVLAWPEDWLAALETLTGVDRYAIASVVWFLVNTVWGIGYLILVARATAGARYANR